MAMTGCGSEPLTDGYGGHGGNGGLGAAGMGDGGASGAGAGGQGGGGGLGAAGGRYGGASGAGVAGQGGSAATGTGGSSSGGGGAGGASSTGAGVACLPATSLITDFTYVVDGGSTSSVHFGDDTTTFSGDEYVYPTSSYPLTSDVTGNNWHISGTIGDYSGFGLSFYRCSDVDASAYKGISFTISGVVASGSFVTMDVATLNDTPAASWLNAHGGTATTDAPGRCIPTSGATVYSQTSCVDPTARIPVTSTPTTINLLWSDFSGGAPEPSVNPRGILTILWIFPAPPAVGTATVITYAVDITIDNLKFIQ